MKRIIKGLFIIIIILFLSLYFSKYTNEYYVNKNVITEEAMERFENDLKTGKEIDAKNYLPEEKDYSNRISDLGLKTSNLIEKAFKKALKYSMKCLEYLENN